MNLPNLKVSDKTNLDNRNSTKQHVAVASTVQHKIRSQNKLQLEELTSKSIKHRQLQEPNSKFMKKATIASDKSKDRLQALERALTQLSNSNANEQLKQQKAVPQEDNSKKRQLHMKSVQAEVDSSKVKGQLRKKTRMMDDNSKSKE